MKECRIGVIGIGDIANTTHLPVLSSFPDVEIPAVCDLIPERLEKVKQAYGVPRGYISYSEMLRNEKLDAVYVLTQPDVSFRTVRDCLLAGKHVFMDKPMGISVLQARGLKGLAAEKKRILHVGFNRRFIPLMREIIKVFCSFTEIRHVEVCYYKNDSPVYYGGMLSAFISDGLHAVDLVRHLAAGGTQISVRPVKAATLEIVNPDTKTAEAWYSTILFDNGVSGLVRSNYSTGGRICLAELHGKGASAYIDLGFGGINCRGKILHTTGAAQGGMKNLGSGQEVIEFDGISLAGSDRFEIFYGYEAEDRCFVQTVLENPPDADMARTALDCASMELAEQLLEARIPCTGLAVAGSRQIR
jgi:predicted dehydrogenase